MKIRATLTGLPAPVDPNDAARLADAGGGAGAFAQTIGDGVANPVLVDHDLGTYDVVVEVYTAAGDRATGLFNIARPTVNRVTVGSDTGPIGASEYRVVVLKSGGEPGSSGGDLVGPAGATDSNFFSADGITGKIAKDSGYSPSSFATAAQGTDSREWTADTVAQAEAEAGVATTRRAWTAQRVAQAIAALATTAWTALTGTITLAQLNIAVSDATLIDTADARLTDARTPTPHDSTHVTGGSDKIRDATAAQDGLMTLAYAGKLDSIEANAKDDQTGAEIKAAYEAEANTNTYTDDEKSKLAGLESSRFKGTYTTLAALTTAHPAPIAGSYAHVDAGIGSPVQHYIWDNDDSEWVQQIGIDGEETAATIKTKYESNADTNAYTDAEKAKVVNVPADTNAELATKETPAGAQAKADAAQAHAIQRANHTGTQSLDTTTDSATRLAMTTGERTKLTDIEANAKDDQSAAEVPVAATPVNHIPAGANVEAFLVTIDEALTPDREGGLPSLRTLGTGAQQAAAGNDVRLGDSREWTAETVSEAEAREGSATTRRAWTAQRVKQSATSPRIGSIVSASTWAINSDTTDQFIVTAQAEAVTDISNPGGTPVDGQKLIIRAKCDASDRALTWLGTQWRGGTESLPTTLVANQTAYMAFIYNAADTKWDFMALSGGFV